MNPNTPLPTAEELAIRQRDFLASDGPTFYSWQELEPPIRALWQKSLQAVLDHLKPWLKEEAPYNCPPIAKQRQEAMVQAIQEHADKCPVETPPGYVAMRGKDLPDKMPYYSAVLNANGEWEVCTAGGLRGVGAFNATQWYAIPAPKEPQLPAVVRQMAEDIGWGKGPQPPDWITDPVKAMECAECPTFLNAVARIKELESEAANHSGELASAKMTAMYAERHQAELQAKLENAEKQAKGLPWVSLSERRPTEQDADKDGDVIITNGEQYWNSSISDTSWHHTVTHFLPFTPPPAPKPEDHRREVFEKAFAGFYDFLKDSSGEYVSPETRQAWTVWQRAIVETENKAQP